MFYGGTQSPPPEKERRLKLVCEWVVQAAQQGQGERELDRRIQAEFHCSRVTSHAYRVEARRRLGDAIPDVEDLAGMLLEWGQEVWDNLQTARLAVKDRIKLQIGVIATLARLCPRRIITVPGGEPVPLFDAEAQAMYLREGGGPTSGGIGNGEAAER